jgi:hypothetical protein
MSTVPDSDTDHSWQLDESQLIGFGRHHRCYYHPADDSLCIKVLQPTKHEKVLRREISYYSHLVKRNIDWRHVARFHQSLNTNLGIGASFELVRNADGSPALPLSQMLKDGNPPLDPEGLAAVINQMMQNIYRQAIVLSDFNLRNLLWQVNADGSSRLVIVDGIGHNDFIPLCEFNRGFAQRKITRTWNRNLKLWFGDYPEIHRCIEPL